MSALNIVRKFFPKVKTVVDAKKATAIEVTPKDAASRAVKDHNHCAMAVACKRKFHLDGVIISRSTAYLIKGTKARRFLLPISVSREVVSFDRGSGFATGLYHLAPSSRAKQLGIRHGGIEEGKKSSKHIRRFRHLTVKVRSVLGGGKPID
jgi:hypothetical protein